jgi:phosphoribosylformylglycinamidine synthase
MLGRLNICSKEYLIRQYDHEVKGGSVVKPLVGVKRDGPGDAAVVRPLLDRQEGIVLSHGICPKFSDFDTYWMMACAIDEAVRGAVASGADPARLAGVDNFCWCDPVQSEKTPDGEYKLAQLVRSCKALEHYCLGFGVPCISGKDSMKNDYTGGGEKISIPPTVLFSVLGFIPDVDFAVTSDFKKSGDAIYLLGVTAKELAGTELASELGLTGGAVPQVDLASAKVRYELLHQAMRQGMVNACHDLSDGGLAVALAEMCIGGRLGARVNLDRVPSQGFVPEDLRPAPPRRTEDDSAPARSLPTEGPGLNAHPEALLTLLYSESASRLLITVPREKILAFQELFAASLGNGDAALIGNVADTDELVLATGGQLALSAKVEELAHAFKATLDW